MQTKLLGCPHMPVTEVKSNLEQRAPWLGREYLVVEDDGTRCVDGANYDRLRHGNEIDSAAG